MPDWTQHFIMVREEQRTSKMSRRPWKNNGILNRPHRQFEVILSSLYWIFRWIFTSMSRQGENLGNFPPTFPPDHPALDQSTEEEFYTRSKSDPRSSHLHHSVYGIHIWRRQDYNLPQCEHSYFTLENNSGWEASQQEGKFNIKLSPRRKKLAICIRDEPAFLAWTKSNLVPLNQRGSNYAWSPVKV